MVLRRKINMAKLILSSMLDMDFLLFPTFTVYLYNYDIIDDAGRCLILLQKY